MDDQIRENIKETLAHKLAKYVKIILKEYGDVISLQDIIRLKQIKNYKNEIEIWNTKTISCFVTSNPKKINFPEQVHKLLKNIKKIPGNGIMKKHLPYNKDNIIINDNTFITYMKHVFIKGIDAKEFYEENLLHESLHFCGSGGASPILEGLTEHRTRELAKKYNLKTTGCGYPKEVKIVDELQEILGKKFTDIYLFDQKKGIEYLEKEQGKEATSFFKKILYTMDDEFDHKYNDKQEEFNGLLGPLKKTLAYSQLEYKETHKLIKEYKEKLSQQPKKLEPVNNQELSSDKKLEAKNNNPRINYSEIINNLQENKNYEEPSEHYEKTTRHRR